MENQLEKLTNISSIDGRYSELTRELRNYFSEFAFYKYRLKVELLYFIFLIRLNFNELGELLSGSSISNINYIILSFNPKKCIEIKEIEKKTNHDVKSIEYYLIKQFDTINLHKYSHFLHFGLTSQDINNPAMTLMVKEGINDIIIPNIKTIMETINQLCLQWMNIVMTSHTHGQPAVPTTLGKEFQVFHYRLHKQLEILNSIKYNTKFGGAVGNINAHYAAYPEEKWDNHFSTFMNFIGLDRDILTTQIDNYENLAVIFDCLRRINSILIDFNRDIWHYISIEYLIQSYSNNHVGSSTMPQKINPIDFENSESNLLFANSQLDFMSNKLPVSRLQRDLTDSTALRNLGSIFGHILIGYKKIIKGLNKIKPNKIKIDNDLKNNLSIITEGIQIILKKHGIRNGYELVKNMSRNNEKLTEERLKEFIKGLEIGEDVKTELLALNQYNYVGNSKKIKLY